MPDSDGPVTPGTSSAPPSGGADRRATVFVFISYQRADAPFAAHLLYYALRSASHEAFIDTGDIGGVHRSGGRSRPQSPAPT
jgi:hypothetical protein